MEEQEYRPRRKKRRSRFVRRLRAFVRHMAELPAQTLLVIGGSIAVILIAVILLVVLLPRGEQVVDGDVNASAAPVRIAGPAHVHASAHGSANGDAAPADRHRHAGE